MAEHYKVIHPIKYYRDFVNHDIRPDGREFTTFRPIALNVGTISATDGSAIVRLGNTTITCGIRAELAKPKPKPIESDCGYLVPNIELIPFCNPKYRSASITADAEVYTSAINDILKNAKFIDLKQLCIHRDKLVWCLYCDISCLNDDGCIIDASLLAIVAAMKNLQLPKVNYDDEVNRISVDDEIKTPIKIDTYPVSTTLMVFDDNVIITDPTYEEQNLSSSIITIATCNSEVCFILKPGGTPFNQEQIDECIKQALEKEKTIVKLLDERFKS